MGLDLLKEEPLLELDNLLEEFEILIYIFPENTDLKEMGDLLKIPFNLLLYYPNFDVFPFEEIVPSTSIKKDRIKTLSSLLNSNEKFVVLTTIHAFTRFTIPKAIAKRFHKNFKIDDVFDINLGEWGYQKVWEIEKFGEYSTKGFIVDLFSAQNDYPLRIELMDDNIERISLFDVYSQRSIKNLESTAITFARENLIIEKELIENRMKKYSIQENELFYMESLPGFFYSKNESLFDYIKDRKYKIFLINPEDSLKSFSIRERENLEMISHDERFVEIYKKFAGLSINFIKEVDFTPIKFDISKKTFVLKKEAERIENIPISTWEDLLPGDYVVHEDYGIGIYKGNEKVKSEYGIREYVVIEYDGGTKIFVPVERLSKLYKYIGDTTSVKLTNLKRSSWKRTKKKVEKAIREKIQELMRIQAMRMSTKGIRLFGEFELEEAFAETFEFTETSDQLKAIEDTLRDLEDEKPMDRLVAGDSGYGKTEVAIRAIFRTVVSGYQAAVMVPTTILARQHYERMRERFEKFGIRIAILDRYITNSKKEEIYEDLNKGKIDVIIGTHSLLNKNIKFNKLGLIVIDEEQKFGVLQKDKFKALVSGINVLLMTATPIPRTLYMALNGIMEMSVLNTPPIGRIPVEVYVGEFSPQIVRKAVLREIARGGQIIYVHNRVQELKRLLRKLEEIVPEAKIVIAHGKMKKSEFQKNINAFYRGQADLLLCTTIIESGVDIAKANTIIVDDSQRYGISQLYQLRGRVGRRDKRGFAYFLFPKGSLTQEALKRLEGIKKFKGAGSGFKLSLLDMEIRGFGNLLGLEQKGHINSVGLLLYKEMLEKIAKELIFKTEEKITKESLDVEILGIKENIVIPEDYIPNPITRMRIYRRISVLKNIKELNLLEEELRDRFGPLPKDVKNLLKYARYRIKSAQLNVKKIELGDVYLKLIFRKPCSFSFWELKRVFKSIKLSEDKKELIIYGRNVEGILEIFFSEFV